MVRGLIYLPSDKLFGCALRSVLWVDGKEHVWEAGSEVGPIGVVVTSRLGCVDILTPWAVDLDHSFAGYV